PAISTRLPAGPTGFDRLMVNVPPLFVMLPADKIARLAPMNVRVGIAARSSGPVSLAIVPANGQLRNIWLPVLSRGWISNEAPVCSTTLQQLRLTVVLSVGKSSLTLLSSVIVDNALSSAVKFTVPVGDIPVNANCWLAVKSRSAEVLGPSEAVRFI